MGNPTHKSAFFKEIFMGNPTHPPILLPRCISNSHRALAKDCPSASLPSMSTSVFRWQHRVTYSECTVGNHVYYARYLDILEEARGEFLRHAGQPLAQLQEANVILPVIEARLRYRGAARYDDVLAVEMAVAELAKVRLEFACRILHESGRLLVEGSTVHACTSLDEKPKRIPEELVAALTPFLTGQPSRRS